MINPTKDILELKNGSIYAKINLTQEFRLGPYQTKWTNEPIDENVAWKVKKSFFFLFYKLKSNFLCESNEND